MFGLFKRKDRDKEQPGGSDEAWGQPSTRKLSKDEAAREAAQQKLVEEKNRERRDMYRLDGSERIFSDSEGRHLALRVEENLGTSPNPHHPPLQIIVFWGTRELGFVQAEMTPQGHCRQLAARVEHGFENRGIAEELLKELETVARRQRAQEIYCMGQEDNEWSAGFLAKSGFSPRGEEFCKTL